MTHEQFYKILQRYEYTDIYGDICIPEKYEIDVAKEILKYNYYRYFASEYDANMIWQGKVPHRVQNYIIKTCKKGEKHERF